VSVVTVPWSTVVAVNDHVLPFDSARLKSVMAHAKRMRWLTYDPAADLESPEQKAITATAAEDIWTPAQMGKFLDHVASHRLGGCFALTLLGLRREEVAGCAGRTSTSKPVRCASFGTATDRPRRRGDARPTG
jgi:hypothetical protein